LQSIETALGLQEARGGRERPLPTRTRSTPRSTTPRCRSPRESGTGKELLRAQEQHHFLEEVVRASPAGILTFDFDGRLTTVNPGA
jgi:PAS domain-containing protein